MKDTVKNNILLAEFLGFEAEKTLEGVEVYAIELTRTDGTERKYKEFYTKIELPFKHDWNLLMLVVEKIFNTDLYHKEYIDYNSSIISNGQIEITTNIRATYNACLEFIKWYNENKK